MKHPKKLSKVIDNVLTPIFSNLGYGSNVYYRIVLDWKILINSDIAKYIRPTALRFHKDRTKGGALYVEATSTGAAMALKTMEHVLLQKFASYFGYKAIDRIVIKISVKKPQNKVEAEDTTITNPIASIKEVNNAILEISDEEVRTLLLNIAEYTAA